MARRSLTALGLAALLLPGCLSFVNSCPKPPPDQRDLCKQLPTPSCEGVYVVLMNGADPFQCSNLQGVREYLATLGFAKSFYAQLYHESYLIDELQEVKREHPNAHFVAVGFEYGAAPACSLANHMAEKGIPLDLLVYLQPKGLSAENGGDITSCRTLTIRSIGSATVNSSTPENVVIEVDSSTRYGVPTHPETLTRLAFELTQLAMNVPVIAPIPETLEDPAPTPRPIKFANNDRLDEWDFLKPGSRQKFPAAEKPSADEETRKILDKIDDGDSPTDLPSEKNQKNEKK